MSGSIAWPLWLCRDTAALRGLCDYVGTQEDGAVARVQCCAFHHMQRLCKCRLCVALAQTQSAASLT
jgi:hypothetical protein